jgi:dTDP-D-glucose 4,6-dehydratase
MYSKSLWFDIDHARQSLGWQPQWSTDEMFTHSYDWFVANRASTDDERASHHRRTARSAALSTLKALTKVLPAR